MRAGQSAGFTSSVVPTGPLATSDAQRLLRLRSEFGGRHRARGKDIPAERAWAPLFRRMVGQDISDSKAQFAARPPHFDMASRSTPSGRRAEMVSLTESAIPRAANVTSVW